MRSKEIKQNMKENMGKELDATGKRIPAGLMMDKMTPLKRTGQMHAVVIPVPENFPHHLEKGWSRVSTQQRK